MCSAGSQAESIQYIFKLRKGHKRTQRRPFHSCHYKIGLIFINPQEEYFVPEIASFNKTVPNRITIGVR